MLIKFIEDNQEKYRCDCCGEIYEDLPLCFGGANPDYFRSIPPNEFDDRVELYESLCIVDNTHFFHRGFLEIPILDYDKYLIFIVWTTISKENFIQRNHDWENPERIHNEPYFGWLQTQIPTFDNTINIQTLAYENEINEIPSVFVIEENHPLKLMQEQGISFDIAKTMVEQILQNYHQTSKE